MGGFARTYRDCVVSENFMPPTSKENEVLVATPEAPASAAAPGAFRPEETSSRPSPVALEVPVSVNGARTVEGSDKREPFSETTKTVLVFGNGAVIRLSSPVAAGQLLFLTNEKTKKEVVCQVVKSKNYRNVSGYVELEFTESVVGFWGMRFPTDSRPATTAPAAGPVPPAAKLNPPASAATAPKAPVAHVVPKAPEVRPAAPQVAQPNLQTPVPQAVAPKPAVPVARVTDAPSPTIAASLASSVASLLGSPEVPPAAIAKPGATQPNAQNNAATRNSDGSTEELKQQAARLQEQLSSMLFGATPAAPEKASTPSAGEPQLDTNPEGHRISKVLELARPEPLAALKPVTPSKPLPAPVKSSLDNEEVKIPSWLEPLARNAAAPTSTQELIEREKAKHAAELAAREREEGKTEPLPLATVTEAPAAAESAPEPEAVGIGNLLPLDGESLSQPTQAGSKRGLWIGVAAAAVLAAAGGGWYFLHSAGSTQGPAATAQNAAAPAAAASTPALQPAARTLAESNATTAQRTAKTAVSQPLANAPATPPITAQPAPVSRDARSSATTIPAAATERIARTAPPAASPAKPEPKKPSLGEVHLAAPTVSHAASEDNMAAPTISGGADSTAAGLGSALVGASASNQPAEPKTPLPVGGDVKPARLLSSTPPTYPALAKTQHISGDVSIDALIDANGKVTTMKVLSGPTLLRQAAMDAVRQWKYQPAALDGKTVSMHLTVTVQFRMQ